MNFGIYYTSLNFVYIFMLWLLHQKYSRKEQDFYIWEACVLTIDFLGIKNLLTFFIVKGVRTARINYKFGCLKFMDCEDLVFCHFSEQTLID